MHFYLLGGGGGGGGGKLFIVKGDGEVEQFLGGSFPCNPLLRLIPGRGIVVPCTVHFAIGLK